MPIRLDDLMFADLRQASVLRCEQSFQSHGGLFGWSVADWALAMIGEAGEVGNAVKKLNRGDGDVAAVAKELADTVIYCDLLAARLDIDLGAAVRAKFNEVSDRVGSDIKLVDPYDGDG